VSLVENQEMPTLKQYVTSIPTLMMNGTTRLPKPIGADTKVLLSTISLRTHESTCKILSAPVVSWA